MIGENTAGTLSDIPGKPLPNGWEFILSNEVYLDADSVSFEGVGITPDNRCSSVQCRGDSGWYGSGAGSRGISAMNSPD